MEDLTAADGVPGDHRDDGLGQPADLHVQIGDEEPADAPLPDLVLPDIAGITPGLLVAARAEGQRSFAGQDDDADLGILSGDGERVGQFLDRLRPERVANLRAVDRDLGDRAPGPRRRTRAVVVASSFRNGSAVS